LHWRIEWTGNRNQIAGLNHLKRKSLIFHRQTVIGKRRLLRDGNMLTRNHKYAAREIDAFNVSQHLQFCAVLILELFAGNFRPGRCGCCATKHSYRTSNDCTGYP
jgi:hypothetical protein